MLRVSGFIENHTGKKSKIMLLLHSPIFDEIRTECIIPEAGFHFESFYQSN